MPDDTAAAPAETETPDDTKPKAKRQTKKEQADAAAATQRMLDAAQALADPTVRRFAAESLEPLPMDEGPLRATASGQVIIQLPDAVVTLRPPLFGDYQELAEMDFLAEGGTFAWWRRAAELVGDAPLPADDALMPMWLANPVYVRQTINHWLLRPSQAPGS